MHPFDVALQLTPTGNDRFHGETSPDYANMVGPYGGITNALMLHAAMVHPERIGDPVALTVNFVAPIADGPYEIVATVARTNRSTQHWTLSLSQAEGIMVTATALFAKRRETWSALEAAPRDVPRPDALTPAPRWKLEWLNRYDRRFVRGGLPEFDGSEHPESETLLWIRDEPPRPLTFTSLASLCDGFFPRIFLRRRRLVPAGTVSMTSYFHADEALLRQQGDRHVLGVARGLNFRNGYFDQVAEVWSDGGDLLATTHQVVYYKE
jgi:hypothetical protein